MWKDIYKYMPMWQGRYASAVLGKRWALQWHAVDHRFSSKVIKYFWNLISALMSPLLHTEYNQVSTTVLCLHNFFHHTLQCFYVWNMSMRCWCWVAAYCPAVGSHFRLNCCLHCICNCRINWVELDVLTIKKFIQQTNYRVLWLNSCIFQTANVFQKLQLIVLQLIFFLVLIYPVSWFNVPSVLLQYSWIPLMNESFQ